MENPLRTMTEIQARRSQLQGKLAIVETKLAGLHDEENEIRKELTHLMIQEERLKSLKPAGIAHV